MATIIEHYTSGIENYAGLTGDKERVYHVLDAASGYAARVLALATAPQVDEDTGFFRKNVMTTPKGANIYECKFKYSQIENVVKLRVSCRPERVKKTTGTSIGSWKVHSLEEVTLSLTNNISASDVEMEVDDVSLIPDGVNFPFVVMIGNEQILVTGWASEVDSIYTVERGYGETDAETHLAGSDITLLMPGPDFGNLINVSKDRVEGVDWWVPGQKLNLQWSSKWSSLDSQYVTTIEGMQGKVNDSQVALTINNQEYVYDRGEMLFLGGDFEDTSDGGASITLDFEIQRNGTVSVGERDGSNGTYLAGIFKYGWDFGWTRTRKIESNGIQIESPASFHVNRMGEFADFSVFDVFDIIVDEEEE